MNNNKDAGRWVFPQVFCPELAQFVVAHTVYDLISQNAIDVLVNTRYPEPSYRNCQLK
jgi:hypothetical protein